MKVLFVTIEPPWPIIGGTPMRSYNLITRIAQHHEVYLACPATVGQLAVMQEHFGASVKRIVSVPLPPRHSLWRRAVGTFTDPAPDLAYRNFQPQLAHAIRQQLGDVAIDVVHLVGLESVGALMGPDWAPPQAKAVLVDEVNAEHVLQQRAQRVELRQPRRWPGALYSWMQARKLKRYERRALVSAGAVTSVSPGDAAILRRFAPGVAIHVVPNGVDTKLYTPASSPTGGASVVFSGTMDFRPNVDAVRWFMAEVWPAVRSGAPGARFIIVGRNPVPVVRRLAATDVVVTGQVLEDLPYLQQAAVYVVPMRFGGGSRLKLLQAMSCALPMVSTTLGADGVAVTAGEQLLIADDPAAFARAVLRLLADPEEGARLGVAGRKLAAAYDWDVVVEQLEAAYAAAVARADAGSAERSQRR
ncbi:MAG: glycosyltransferase [Dehalococcoidia bacterium]|nr:glycosyltransferase [Dehalococcoidia bacterium]